MTSYHIKGTPYVTYDGWTRWSVRVTRTQPNENGVVTDRIVSEFSSAHKWLGALKGRAAVRRDKRTQRRKANPIDIRIGGKTDD